VTDPLNRYLHNQTNDSDDDSTSVGGTVISQTS